MNHGKSGVARHKVALMAILAIIGAFGALAGCAVDASGSKPPKANKSAKAAMAAPAGDIGNLMAALAITAVGERQEVPRIELLSPQGAKSALSDYRGKAVLLNFWATWCPPCRAEMPSLQRMRDELLKEGVAFEIVSINVGEDKKTIEAFMAENGYDFPVFLDESGAISKGFVGQGIPTSYIVDKAGKAAGFIIGSREWDVSETLELFRALAAE